MFSAQHSDTPLSAYTSLVAKEISAGGEKEDDKESVKLLRQLLQSFMLTNRILGATYGSDTGISDRRSGTAYFFDVGFAANPELDNLVAESITPEVFLNTSRVAELCSPSLGNNDVKFEIGVDSYSIHRAPGTLPAGFISWPVSVICPTLQKLNGSRYFAELNQESGNSLSATAKTTFYGELPNLLAFKFGFMSPIANDKGVLDGELYPLTYNALWEATGNIPVIPGSAPPVNLWSTSYIYSITLRLFVIPTITPRPRVQST